MAGKEAPPRTSASGPDRISDLPDGVREHVLSFLPAHEAVRTSVLARSWRDLWMRSHALLITGWGTPAKFIKFVRRLLRLRLGDRAAASARLVSCDFDFGEVDFDEEGLVAVNKALLRDWIWRVARSSVEVVRVVLWPEKLDMEPKQLKLPVSEHLKELELTNVYDLSGDRDNFLDFSDWPVLRKLTMNHCQVHAEEMWLPSLEHLSMVNCEFHLFDCTQIYVPSLISLELIDFEGRTPQFENIASLRTAVVRLSHLCSDICIKRRSDYLSMDGVNDCGDVKYHGCVYYECDSGLILEGMPEATHLELSAHPDMLVFNRDLCGSHTFDKLKTLMLVDWFVAADLSGLSSFLKRSPVLERLILQLSLVQNRSKGQQGYIPSQLSVPVASKHLKHVEIKCEVVDGMVLVILKTLNASGISLEQICIQCSEGGYGCFNFACTSFSSI